MFSLITTNRYLYDNDTPTVYIAPIIDKTKFSVTNEKGAVATVGYLDFGNPNDIVSVRDVPFLFKPVDASLGGDPKNETYYHIADHLETANTRVWCSRLLGKDSTCKVIEYNAGTQTLSSSTVKVFGDVGSYKDWVGSGTKAIEILPTLTPTAEITVGIKFTKETNELDITIQDEYNTTLYEVRGNIDKLHTKGVGQGLYFDGIENVTDKTILDIRVDKTSSDFDADFISIQTYTPTDIITDDGDVVQPIVFDNLRKIATRSDYFATFGQQPVTIAKQMYLIAVDASCQIAIDFVGGTLDEAKNYFTSLNIVDKGAIFLWSNAKTKYRGHYQFLGLSGDYVAKNVKRNLSEVIGIAEYRSEAIMNLDWYINRQLREHIYFDIEDRADMTKNRIIYMMEYKDRLVYSDCLGSYQINTQLKKFPTVDIEFFMRRQLGFILESYIGKNEEYAETMALNEAELFLEDCKQMRYFAKDTDYELTIETVNGEELQFRLKNCPIGIIRKGRVEDIVACPLKK